ncbi:hypothetical protein B5E65_12790 [Gemmiger sp. An120]|uniref:hypothetical protein n=1 Tax=Gemmiger sp. An120 TaxID=1965549 RepID=UPI000B37AD2C|nr:hypothetical protein [Gemmiger sp. An120]OUQ41263.1 hypothetical protein B5E65_12790 [Gemmiger sp. An120]
MVYDFDQPVERRGTYSAKWDGVPMFPAMGLSERGDGDTLPLFTADMDFRCPDSVREEILKVAQHNLYGYTLLHPALGSAYYDAVRGWFERRHGWKIRRKIYQDANVVLESGRMFDPDGGDGFERICLSTRRALVQEAFQRIARQFEGL